MSDLKESDAEAVRECAEQMSREVLRLVRVFRNVLGLAMMLAQGCSPHRPPLSRSGTPPTAKSGFTQDPAARHSEAQPSSVAPPRSSTHAESARAPDAGGPGAKPADAPPVFPTHTTTHDPKLARDLDPSRRLLPYLTSSASLRRDFTSIQDSIDAVRRGFASKTWKLQIRTTCPVEAGGDVFVEGRAVVHDSDNHLRVFSERSGTGDSAGTWRYYYGDSQRLRAVIFTWRSYNGSKADGVAVFDVDGRRQRCRSLPGDEGALFCPENMREEQVDSAVQGVMRPELLAERLNELRAQGPLGSAASIDPMAEFSKCEQPYVPGN